MDNSLESPLISPAWHVLAEREANLRKTHNCWRREGVRKAIPLTTEQQEEAVASWRDAFTYPDISPAAITHLALENVAVIENGEVVWSELDMVRIGDLRKAKMATQIGDSEFETIDLFDGVKVGHFQLENHDADTTEDSQWRGSIRLDRSLAMDRSANGGRDILLMQMRVGETFSPDKSVWAVHDDFFVLTTQKGGGSKLRLTLSKKTGCPISLEELRSIDNEVRYVHQVTQTRIVADFEIPSEVVSFRPSNGSVDDYEFKYVLESCHLNDEVDESASFLPGGTQVWDFRLGERHVVTYETTDGELPSDEHVKNLSLPRWKTRPKQLVP